MGSAVSTPDLRSLTSLGFELLEERTLLTVSSSLNNGLLTISLSAAGDSATVSLSNGNIDVFDGTNHADFATSLVTSISATGASVGNQTVVFEDALSLTGALTTSAVSQATLNGSYAVGSADLAATTIALESGSALDAGTTGDVSLLATDSESGASASSSASITIDDAAITGNVITIQATSSASTLLQGGVLEQATLGSTASVTISSGSSINAAGNVAVGSSSTIDAQSLAGSSSTGGVTGVDAAIATANVTSTSNAVVNDSTVHAGGSFSLSAIDTTTSTTTADGTSGGSSAAGGSVGVNVINDSTTASVGGASTVTAAGVSVSATTTESASTLAKATAMGATNNNPDTKNDLTNYNAKTNDGPVSVAGALAITSLSRTNLADIATSGTISSSNGVSIVSSATTSSTATADGSSVGGNTGVGVAVAIDHVNASNLATLGGTTQFTSGPVNVQTQDPAPSLFSAKATSGAGAQSVGVAGALALNIVTNTSQAGIASGSSIAAGGASLGFSATDSIANDASALPANSGGGGSVGVGASVALDFVNNTVSASVPNGASLAGANNLSLASSAEDQTTTTVETGASGGTAVGAGVALSIVQNNARSGLGTAGSLPLSITGSLMVSATNDGSTSTSVSASAAGSNSEVGAAIALNFVNDSSSAMTSQNLTSGKDATFSAVNTGTSSAYATASAAGAPGSDSAPGGQTVDGQIGNQTTFAKSEAPAGADTTTTSPASASASNGTSSGGTKVSVAAAIAVNASSSTANATIPTGIVVNVGGALSLLTTNASTGSATADGSAVNTGSSSNSSGSGASGVAIGAAVAINDDPSSNEALIASGATVTAAGGVTLSATNTGTANPANSFVASATSGDGGGNIGIAGSVAINIVSDTTLASIIGGATVDAGGGDVSMTATDSSSATTSALPSANNGQSGKFGLGASVALAIVTDTATAELGNGATLTNANNLSLTSSLSDTVVTTASMGSAGNISITPSIGLSIVKNTSKADLGTVGSSPLSIGGGLTLSATNTGSTTTSVMGSAAGGKASIGASLALDVRDGFGDGDDESECDDAGRCDDRCV